ncbi:MAG TPA: hypothetical protein VN577_05765 [Terriglobales bacterium]|nr:hypothetical protein [Terriglobales bacterium]
MSNHHNDPGELHYDASHHGAGFENRDLGGRGIMVFLIVLMISGILICLVLWGYFGYRAKNVVAEPPITGAQQLALTPEQQKDPTQRFPKPVLQPDDVADMNKMRAQENAILDSYGWVDKNAGVVRVPIDTAIKAVAQQGLPTRPQQQPAQKAEFGSGVDTPAGLAGGTRPETRQ